MRVLRKAIGLAVVLTVAFVSGVLNNNLPERPGTRAEFQKSLNRAYADAVEWVLSQPREPNTYLTAMVQDCATLSGDQRLQKWAADVMQRNPDPPNARMVNPTLPFARPSDGYVAGLSDYQRWILHAISKKAFYLTEADKAEMFRPDKHRTGRATHQLFALNLYRQFNGETKELNALMRHISERIAQEAAVDFRVTDIYLQRIAFLLAAGQPDLVQPRWVQRALARQQPSGGWFGGWYGWQASPLTFKMDETEDSHATVQGMWLTCMLKFRYADWVESHYR